MKKTILLSLITCFVFKGFSQGKENENTQILLKELSENSCKCIGLIDTIDKFPKTVSKEINKCINKQVSAYQLGFKLMKIDTTNLESKNINILINANEYSNEFKKYYYEIERYLFENCSSLKSKIASFEKRSNKSISENPKALEFYSKGISEIKKQNLKKAILFFKKSVQIDPTFAFAWDNLGISYRKLNNYDKAIESYEKSLEIDPNGLMPLQNIAVVYQYKKEYKKAIKTYERLAELDENNPEIYYGIGQIYSLNLQNYEKGLDNMCKAYNMYAEQKSPYRTDAEKVISMIYSEMKKLGREQKFDEILKLNNISQ